MALPHMKKQLLVRSSSKIYGRQHEIELVVQAYQRTATATRSENGVQKPQELVLIHGYSGSGKTALANTLSPVVRQGSGLFVSGKFESAGALDPYAVFVSAINQLTEQLLGDSSVDNLSNVRSEISLAVGEEGKLLTDMIPALENIMGKQDSTCEVSGTEALHRLHTVFCKFCRAISTVVPLVMLFDDLQWSDQASLELLQALLQPISLPGKKPQSLLIVGTYREEMMEDHEQERPLNKSLSLNQGKLFKHFLQSYWHPGASPTLSVTSIHLSRLEDNDMNNLISGVLNLPPESVLRLTERIQAKCNGNVYSTLQYLRLLCDLDPAKLQAALGEIDQQDAVINCEETVDAMVQQKLRSMPAFAQKVLQVAACIGDEVDEMALGAVLDGNTAEISKSIADAMKEEFLVFEPRGGRYHFVHDRIRQAAYSMVNDVNKMSFDIGYKLWQRLAPMYMDAKMFTIVNLINRDVSQLRDETERYKAAALNMEAGIKAVSLAAFPDASRYLAAGIAFLEGSDHWNVDYQLSLKLFNMAADAELCNQTFDRVRYLVAEIFEHARSPQDKSAAYAAHVNAVGQSGSVHEAMNIGLQALSELGEQIESTFTPHMVAVDIKKAAAAVRGKSNQELLALPPMSDKNKLAAVYFWNLLLPYTFQAGSPLTVICGTRAVRLCLEYGLTKASAIGFATFGWVLCERNRKEGFRLGQLALSIIERTRARELIPRVHPSYYYFTHHWIRPLRESLDPLKNAHRVAVEVGDIEYAIYASFFYCANALYSGMKIKKLESIMNEAAIEMKQYQQENMLQQIQGPRQYIQNLTGRASDPKILQGECSDINEKSENVMVLSIRYALGADLAYMFEDYELAEQLMSTRLGLNFEFHAHYVNTLNTVRDGLIAIARARQGVDRRRNIKVAKSALQKITCWTKDCPDNFLNKQKLLEAELKSLASGKSVLPKIVTLYDQSIQQAVEQGFLPEAARACERAGDYMHRQQSYHRAFEYWQRSRAFYDEWGATTKASQMKTKSSQSTRP